MKSHPIQQEFQYQQREYHHLYKYATHDNHCLFSRVLERALGRYGYLDLGLGKPEVLVRDTRYVKSKTRCLIRVGVGRSDGRHKANPSFHAITKMSRILGILAVFMMGIEECVKEAQNHNTILKGL